MSAQRIHVCIDIAGVLAGPDRALKGLVGDQNGDRLSVAEAREWLADQRAKGRRVLPFGRACKGFSYQTGCPGHPLPKSPLLRRIQPRALRPRVGESLRDAELRWQARNDPRIAAAVRGGCSRAEIAQRVGVSKTAILGALRRAAKRQAGGAS